MFDPTGPGTPAWNACDNAIEAYQTYLETGSRRSLKRYHNQRQYMIALLRDHGQDPEGWCKFIRNEVQSLTGYRISQGPKRAP